MRLGLAGPSHEPYSRSADTQRTVNLFPERIGERGKAPTVLYGTPGLETRVTLSSSNGVKAIFYETVSKRTFAAKRTTSDAVRLSELTTTSALGDTETDRGELIATGGTMVPASISSNGIELFIVLPDTQTAHLFVLATNTLTDITSSVGEGSPVWGQFLDGYFIALDANGKFYLSSANDGATWDATDVATPESSPDRTTMILAHNGELWLFGPESVEVWTNTGGVDFPFQPIRTATMKMGLAFTYSVAPISGSLFWVTRDRGGDAEIVEAQGYHPQPVSNYAVTHSIQSKEVTGAAPVAWSHQAMGHSFYLLTFPDDALTWAYDIDAGRESGWHERMHLNGSTEEAHRGRCCEFVGGEDGAAKAHLVGDRANGKIYSLSMDNYDDAGVAIRRIRRSQHISNEMKQIIYHALELDVEHGNWEAIYNLRWSDDEARTFGSEMATTVAADSDINPEWRVLGTGRDRVFEVYSDSAVKHAWLDAYMQATPGVH